MRRPEFKGNFMKAIWNKFSNEKRDTLFPVGNGRLAAQISINSSPAFEEILLYEESLWSKPYSNRNNPNSQKDLSKISSHLKEGHNTEAADLIKTSIAPLTENHSVYNSVPTASLQVKSYLAATAVEFSEFTDQKTTLDMENGILSRAFSAESPLPSTADLSRTTRGSSIQYTQDIFASQSQDVIVLHFSASTPKSIFFRACFSNTQNAYKAYGLGEDTIALQYTYPIPHTVMATAVTSGGTVCVKGATIVVENADEATIYVDIQTAYRHSHYRRKKGDTHIAPKSLAAWTSDRALKNLCFASSSVYTDLYKDHVQEFSSLYNETKLNLNSSSDSISYDEFVNKKNEAENAVAETVYDFSKYLNVCSSAKNGTLNSSLWGGLTSCKAFIPLCAYSVNVPQIQTFNILKKLYKNGKKTARVMFGLEGFAGFETTDIWGDSAPCANSQVLFPSGGIFASLAVRSYYEHTMDYKFLKKNFYIIKEACRFFAGYLEQDFFVEENEKKLIAKLFDAAIECARDLNEQKFLPLIEEWKTIRATLGNLYELEEDEFCVKTSLEEKGLSKRNAPVSKKESLAQLANELDSESLLSLFHNSIAQSSLKGNCAKIILLPAPVCKEGKFSGLKLRGNIMLDIEWKEKKLIAANLRTMPGSRFAQELQIVYMNKTYQVPFKNGTLNVLNVLPTTI